MTLLRVNPKKGLVYTGHGRTLSKVSNGSLIGLTDQGKSWVTIYYKFIVLLKKIQHIRHWSDRSHQQI